MRILILLVLLLELSKANMVFRDKENIEVVSLGEYDSKSKLKVYKNGKIVFIDDNNLEQIDQYDTKVFVKFLDKHNLEFQMLVDNKWELKIYRKKLYIKRKTQKQFRVLDVEFYYYMGASSGFYVAFKTKNNDTYGFITYDYVSKKNRYSMDVKTKNNILSAPLTIHHHKE